MDRLATDLAPAEIMALGLALALCAAGVGLATRYARRAQKPTGREPGAAILAILALSVPILAFTFQITLVADQGHYAPAAAAAHVALTLGIAGLSIWWITGRARPAGLLFVALVGCAALAGALAIELPSLFAVESQQSGEPFGRRPVASAVLLLLTALLLVGLKAGDMMMASSQRDLHEDFRRSMGLDPETGLARMKVVRAEFARRVALGEPERMIAMASFQIANLPELRAQYGSSFADHVVRLVGSLLESQKAAAAVVAHEGRGRFTGIDYVENAAEMEQRMRRLAASYASDLVVKSRPVRVEVRIGVAFYPTDGADAGAVEEKAHSALEVALSDPLGDVVLHNLFDAAEVKRKATLANDMRGALGRDELALFLQPQVTLRDRRIIGYEALLRWRHPELGLVSPGEFVPLAESSGLIVQLGEWALRESCRAASALPPEYHVAVNLSPLQLRQKDLPDCIMDALKASGIEPHRLEIELTETLLIDDPSVALVMLERMKALGVRLVLDDFGAGYSSMSVLKRFPFDRVKLDRSFVEDVPRSSKAEAILHAMFDLGRKLEMPVMAEGVESEWQLFALERAGCEVFQGFMGGRPCPAEQVLADPGQSNRDGNDPRNDVEALRV
ncbi:EAL domain-containing protein [Qipengyuania sp.]|uniref:bifunctional diguanylate cyclase/phosphodiesterase n=1 Tax=Qipengyuania sp. TaxID=2004515 RepID=UPI0035C7AA3C